MGERRFTKLSAAMAAPTPHLYVANCGPALKLTVSEIVEAFEMYGPVVDVSVADDSGTRVIVSFERAEDAEAARDAWNGKPCAPLRGIHMFIDFAVPKRNEVAKHCEPVYFHSSDLEIPGLSLHTDFISPVEEMELLGAVDQRSWQTLAKRKVQHYGYEFLYKVRNVDLSKRLVGGLPTFVADVVKKISALPEVANATENSLPFDQLTVNEYPRGVGLSPHVDTHSAFEGSIISLSLAGPCIMEFRKYQRHSNDSHKSEASRGADINGSHLTGSALEHEAEKDVNLTGSALEINVERKVLYLPPRSLLILSNEARYGWHHYIPHHKEDLVNGESIPRSSRRVSFTFRKVRIGSCKCHFSHVCDSQTAILENLVSNIKVSGSEDINGFTRSRGEDIIDVNMAFDKVHEVSLIDGELLGKDASISTSVRHDVINQETPSCCNLRNFEKEEICFDVVHKVQVAATPEIEKRYVQEVYDAIAPHFSSTRFAKWPKVAEFLHSLPYGSIVVDAGCGNGKYLGLNSKCLFVGCDISAPLIAICAQRGHEVLVADALFLPYRTASCDAAISIAVLHHLSSEQRRIRAIEELLRVVCGGGKVLITVWAVEQEDKSLLTKWTPLTGKYMEEWVGNVRQKSKRSCIESSLNMIQEGDFLDDRSGSADEEQYFVASSVQKSEVQEKLRQRKEQQEYFVPWHLPYHRAEIGGASMAAVESGLARKDDKKGAVVYDRYYHVFVKDELERLISKCIGASVVDRFYDKSNWCVVIEKL